MSHKIKSEDNATIVIIASPIPSHPSPFVIEQTLSSLRYLDLRPDNKVIVAHDGLSPVADRDAALNYWRYIEELARCDEIRKRDVEILVSPTWGHLSGTIEFALNRVSTEYLLLMQHDLPFIDHIEIGTCVRLMKEFGQIRHLRFNNKKNIARGFDSDAENIKSRQRMKSFREELFILSDKKEVRLMKTLGWSDRNHLCRKAYYSEIVLPILGARRGFPEVVMNNIACKQLHGLLGTFIYGGEDFPPTTRHIDGRKGRHETIREQSTETSSEEEISST